MLENYQFERVAVAATGGSAVEILAAPPEGVAYRIFYINGKNDEATARLLYGRVLKVAAPYICFQALALAGQAFVGTISSTALAEWPTIAVLADTDESFQIYLHAAGTMTITLCYEIVEKQGPRSYRSAFATLAGATPVKLIDAPTTETVHRLLTVNGYNTIGAARSLFLTAGTGAPENGLAQLAANNNTAFMPHLATNQAPFPPIYLSGTSDSLYMYLSGSGTNNMLAAYEVLSRRVV